MADETWMPACICRLWKIKQTLTLQPKQRKKKFCYFVGVLCIIFLAQNLFSVANKQTENLKIILE